RHCPRSTSSTAEAGQTSVDTDPSATRGKRSPQGTPSASPPQQRRWTVEKGYRTSTLHEQPKQTPRSVSSSDRHRPSRTDTRLSKHQGTPPLRCLLPS